MGSDVIFLRNGKEWGWERPVNCGDLFGLGEFMQSLGCIFPDIILYSLYGSVEFVSHTAGYVFHTVVFVSHTVGQRNLYGFCLFSIRTFSNFRP